MSKPSLPPVQFNKRESQIITAVKKGKEKPKVKQVALGAYRTCYATREFFVSKYFAFFIAAKRVARHDQPCHYNALITIVIAEQYMYMTKQVDQFYFNLCHARLLYRKWRMTFSR